MAQQNGGFHKWGIPKMDQNGWCIMDNPIKTDDLGNIPILGNLQIATQPHLQYVQIFPRHASSEGHNGSLCSRDYDRGADRQHHHDQSDTCLHFASSEFSLHSNVVNQYYAYLVGGFTHEFYFPFHIWDVIQNPLTFTPSFFKMVKLHHQPGYY